MADQHVYNNAETIQHVKNKLRDPNKHEFRAEFSLPGHIAWRAARCFLIDRTFGNFTGKYLIDHSTHRITSSSYEVSIEAHKVLKGY